MSLRLKLALLMGAFCLFMIGSVGSVSWCIAVYLDATVSGFGQASFLAGSMENLRNELHLRGPGAVTAEAIQALGNVLDDLDAANVPTADLRKTVREIKSHQASSGDGAGTLVPAPEQVSRLQAEVRQACLALSDLRKTSHDKAYGVQSIVLGILTANIVVGCLLVVLAFLGVQRWITRPILQLHEAAGRWATGKLDYRVPIRSTDEVGQLSSAVNTMAASLADAQLRLVEKEREAALGEMARTVAHNLRNPLAGMRACAQSSIMHLTKDPQALEQCNQIIGLVDHCDRWIRNLLQVNRPVEITPEATSLPDMIRRVVDTSRPFAQRRSVKVETELRDVGTSTVDSQLFEQALAVLVGNAIEASAEGQSVQVIARTIHEPAATLIIDVNDCGPGIPADLRERVFEPFFSTKPTGTGIGLHFARRIIRAHDGDLRIMERPGADGTCFRLSMPLEANGKGMAWPQS